MSLVNPTQLLLSVRYGSKQLKFAHTASYKGEGESCVARLLKKEVTASGVLIRLKRKR
jgi:hypothetical protein